MLAIEKTSRIFRVVCGRPFAVYDRQHSRNRSTFDMRVELLGKSEREAEWDQFLVYLWCLNHIKQELDCFCMLDINVMFRALRS